MDVDILEVEQIITDLGLCKVKQRILMKKVIKAITNDDCDDCTINALANKLGCDSSTLRRNLSKIINDSYDQHKYKEEFGLVEKPKGKQFLGLVIKKTKK